MSQRSYEYKSCAKACDKTSAPKDIYMGGKPTKTPKKLNPKSVKKPPPKPVKPAKK